jgi:hypothetical protein
MALMGILPKEGSFTTLKIVQDLRMHLALSEDEHKALSIEEVPQADGRTFIRWDMDAAAKADKEVPLGEKATDLIVEELKKLNEKDKLDESTFEIYDKFVESKR